MLIIIRKWSFLMHLAAALVIAIVVRLATTLMTFRSAASIGIIGAADGPTTIYVASKFLSGSYLCILIFVILLALYIPVKRLVER